MFVSSPSRAAQQPAGKETSKAPPCFVNDVMPLLSKAGCNQAACHAAGLGGLKLSLFGSSPKQDYNTILSGAQGKWLDRDEPAKSLLLAKASGSVPHHPKKKLIPQDSPGYKTLLAWVAGGMVFDGDKLTALEVKAPTVTLAKGESTQVVTTAVFANGRKDVTLLAQFRSADPQTVAVDASGKMTAIGFGQTFVRAKFLHKAAVVRVLVPQTLTEPFPEFPARNGIDPLVQAKLKELGFPPSELCTDQEFLRRAYLDVTGRLPTVPQVKEYLADKDAGKRAKLIDMLLDSNAYADFWALKWGDLLRLKSEQDSKLWPLPTQLYHNWIRESIASDKPYDKFVREMLVSTGSNMRNPPVNFYRAVRSRVPANYSQSAALAFMGVRLACSQCHLHPSDSWTQEDNAGMAAFFTQVRMKNTHEWKEEIVYLDPQMTKARKARPLGGAEIELAANEDGRARFADWLLAPDNPYFARNIVNRVWSWLLGRGIIHDPDDIRPTNPPTNPELLTFLEKELVRNKYRLKPIFRLILNSRAYQLSSKTNKWNAIANADFSHYRPKRLSAEQLSDAIGQVTGVYDTFMSQVPEPWTWMPEGSRAVQLADGSISTPLLYMFGRPSRNTGYESERDGTMSPQQAIYLLDSWEIKNKVQNGPVMNQLLASKTRSDKEIVEEIYVRALARSPNDREQAAVAKYLETNKNNRRQAFADVVWAVINTKEFLTIR